MRKAANACSLPEPTEGHLTKAPVAGWVQTYEYPSRQMWWSECFCSLKSSVLDIKLRKGRKWKFVCWSFHLLRQSHLEVVRSEEWRTREWERRGLGSCLALQPCEDTIKSWTPVNRKSILPGHPSWPYLDSQNCTALLSLIMTHFQDPKTKESFILTARVCVVLCGAASVTAMPWY